MFHYRLVGLHASSVVSDGGDGTFFTEPRQAREDAGLGAHEAEA